MRRSRSRADHDAANILPYVRLRPDPISSAPRQGMARMSADRPLPPLWHPHTRVLLGPCGKCGSTCPAPRRNDAATQPAAGRPGSAPAARRPSRSLRCRTRGRANCRGPPRAPRSRLGRSSGWLRGCGNVIRILLERSAPRSEGKCAKCGVATIARRSRRPRQASTHLRKFAIELAMRRRGHGRPLCRGSDSTHCPAPGVLIVESAEQRPSGRSMAA